MKKSFLLILFLLIRLTSSQPAVSAYRGVAEAETIPLNIKFQTVVTGLNNPLFVTHAGDASGRLFIVQNDGKIFVYKNGALVSTPFLNMGAVITSGGERGLLGLAFAPDYETSGKFYVYYNNLDGNIEIARYLVSDSNADRANGSSRLKLLTIVKPDYTNHNGGWIGFGPDGYLYAAVGDGGGGGDPNGNGQNTNSLMGKILRIDVNGDDFPADAEKNYAIPADNPFVGVAGADEVWAYGLRNPWRPSFDRSTGDLYIADVGQGMREEVNFQPAASTGGENYGWNVLEGTLCYNPSTGCDPSGKIFPVAEYSHNAGCSITGGYVYRGSEFPELQGVYLYMDFCEGTLFGLTKNSSDQWINKTIRATPYRPTSFGEDENGELYITDYTSGSVLKVIKASLTNATFKSQGANDGVVLESTENSGTGGLRNTSLSFIQIGDDSQNRQFRGILSFNTSGLPDNAGITKVTLKMRRSGIVGGGDPLAIFHGFMVDVRKGAFGTAFLENGDFQAAAHKTLGPFTPVLNNGSYTMNLTSAKALINKYSTNAGVTQIRLRLMWDDNNNSTANFIKLFSGDEANTAYRPRLIIQYYRP